MRRYYSPRSQIAVPPTTLHRAKITIVGDSPLICRQRSFNAKKEALSAPVYDRDAIEELYPINGHFGLLAPAFKFIANGARRYAGIRPTAMRTFYVAGEIVPIEGDCTTNTEILKGPHWTSTRIIRAKYRRWQASLTVQYQADLISMEQVTRILEAAGFLVGLGEGRPQQRGSYGRFHVSDAISASARLPWARTQSRETFALAA